MVVVLEVCIHTDDGKRVAIPQYGVVIKPLFLIGTEPVGISWEIIFANNMWESIDMSGTVAY